jgi:hypothetical protein
VSSLLPEGVEHLVDAPYSLHQSILFALRVIRWEEELSPDERPPKRIWLDNPRLEAHFAEVQRKRDEKYGGNGSRDDRDLADNDPRVKHNTVRLITSG